VEAVHGLALDYDDENEAGERLFRSAWGRWRYLAHTSGSHGIPKGDKPAGPRWRVLLAYTRPVSPAEHRRIGAWARHPRKNAGIVGAEAEHPARWYFRPARGPGGYEWHSNEGPDLDPEFVLAELARWEAEETSPDEAPEADPLVERVGRLDACRLGAFLEDELDRLRARADRREVPIPLPWPNVSRELGGGLWPGMYVLVGNTGSGKSQWALQAGLHAAHAGIPVLYVGLELGRTDLVARLVGLISGRKWSRLYLGADPSELADVEASCARELAALERVPFHLETAPPHGWDYRELAREARAMRELYPEGEPGSRPFLVVLDFLQLVTSPEGAREDLRERIGRAAYAGRAVARDFGASVLLVSSTAREHYGALSGEPSRTNTRAKGPALGAGNPARLVGLGKESGELEYACDGALVLAAEPWPDKTPPMDGTRVWLALAKMRAKPEGSTGWAPLRFDGGRFREPTATEVAADRRAQHSTGSRKAARGNSAADRAAHDYSGAWPETC